MDVISSVGFNFSNFGFFFILLNLTMEIMLHRAPVSNLKAMLKSLTIAYKVISLSFVMTLDLAWSM